MATQQEVIDVQYDIKLAEQQEKLKSIFSETILGWGLTNSIETFEGFKNYSGSFNFSGRHLFNSDSLKGLSYLLNMTRLYIAANQLTSMEDLTGLTNLLSLYLYNNDLTYIGDLSGLTSLTELKMYTNKLTDIGSVSKMTSLEYLSLYDNELTDIGDVSNLTSLVELKLYNNNLTDIGSLSALMNLTDATLQNNNFDTSTVDQILEDCVTILDDGGTALTTVNLAGNAIPTGGASNANYLDLIGQGISVTIQTT